MSGNDTMPSYDSCDKVSDECPVDFTIYGDYLSTGASAFFGIAFLLCFLVQFFLGLRGRYWSLTIWLSLGVGFEVLGYLGRLLLSKRPWSMGGFTVQYLTLLLAPTLIAAAISVTFKHIVLWYGPEHSLLRPKLLPWIFVGTDFISIFIQIIGGGATAAASTGSSDNTDKIQKIGEVLTIGGVAFQIVNMVVCAVLMLLYAHRRKTAIKNQQYAAKAAGFDQGYASDDTGMYNYGRPVNARAGAPVKEAKRARLFCYALGVAYVAIIVRCSYRYVIFPLHDSLHYWKQLLIDFDSIFENLPGMGKDVIQNEALFYGLDGAPMLIAVLCITVLHPFYFFPALKPRNKTPQPYQEQYAM